MMRLPRTLLAVLALLAATAGAAGAQSIDSPYRYIQRGQSLSFFGGYLFASPSLTLNDSVSVDIGPRSAPVFGARYQLRFGGPLAAELSLGFSPSDRKVYTAEALRDSTEIRPIDTGRTATSPIAMAELGVVFNLTGPRTWNGLAPFVKATGGLAAEIGGTDEAEENVPEGKRFDFGPAFAVGAGIGTDYFPTERLSVRLELHGRLWRLSAPDGLTPLGDDGIGGWANASAVTLGAAYHF